MKGVFTVKKRTHRLVVEVTFSSPVGEREAQRGLQLTLSGVDLGAKPVWLYSNSPYLDKLVVKAFSRVYLAQRHQDRERAAKAFIEKTANLRASSLTEGLE